jgi:hypothetical protein
MLFDASSREENTQQLAGRSTGRKNTTNGQPTRSLDGSTMSHRRFGSALQKVAAGPRTLYAREERQPPTWSA